VQDRIKVVKDLSIAPECQWVIEVVFEDEEMKKELFKDLDATCPAETILASNTSSIPITRLASLHKRPERVVGLHFFGPVPMMRLVEVIKGQKTADAVFKKGVDFINSIGQYPVKVMKDIPGFIMNRVSGVAFREALSLVENGIATVEDVDKGMHYGFNWNIGPFEIADNAGIDTYVRVGRSFAALGASDIVAASPLMEKILKAGRLGAKVGKVSMTIHPEQTNTLRRHQIVADINRGGYNDPPLQFDRKPLVANLQFHLQRLACVRYLAPQLVLERRGYMGNDHPRQIAFQFTDLHKFPYQQRGRQVAQPMHVLFHPVEPRYLDEKHIRIDALPALR
jgi:3-hydroxybutyryl-CoA dehydrogenase